MFHMLSTTFSSGCQHTTCSNICKARRTTYQSTFATAARPAMPEPRDRCKSSRNGPKIRSKTLKNAEKRSQNGSFLAACASPPRRAATFPTFAGLWAGSTFNMCQHLVVGPLGQHSTYVPTFTSEWCQHPTSTVAAFLSTFPRMVIHNTMANPPQFLSQRTKRG